VPAFSFNLATATAMPANTSFARSSSATYFDGNGNLQTATTSTPRFGYDYWAHSSLGLIVEGAATNSIRNNSMQGVVTGTPGTLPTNWSIAFNGITGLSQQVVGQGTENNIDYVDLRIFGTASAAGELQIYYEATNNIASGNGTRWIHSSFLKLVGGSVNNLSFLVQDIDQRNASNTFLAFVGNGNNVCPSCITTNFFLRFSDTFSTNQSTIAFVSPALRMGITAAAATDVTIRIGLPQLEASGGTTSVIRTTSAAVTRAADVPSFTGAAATLLGGSSYSVVARSAASSNNNAIIGAATANFPGLGFINPNFTTSNGSGVNQLSTAFTTPSFIVNLGLSVGGTARFLTSNGGTLRGGTTGSDAANIPLGTTFGTDAAQNFPINGSITSINLYNISLTQAQLETATNPVETTAWGDSLTAGTGSSSPTINYGYIGNLNALTQQTFNDQGVGGQTSGQITTRCQADTAHINDNTIIEMGRNNIGGIPSFTVTDIQNCINHLALGNTRYVVLSIINGAQENSAATGTNLTNYNSVLAFNAAMAAAFPGHYLDVRAAIVLASGGANDAPPPTWMFAGQIHPNDAGYQVMARAVYNFGLANNWPGYGAQNCTVAGLVDGPDFIQSPDNLAGADWGAPFNATTAQGQGTAPDGTNNLNTLIDNATNEAHFVSQGGLNPPAGKYTWSVFLKQNTLRFAHISLLDSGNGNTFGNIFDLQAGTVGVSNTLGSPTGTSATITPCASIVPLPPACGTGIYLATITMNFSGGGVNFDPIVSTSNSATPAYDAFGSPLYIGSGQSIFVWDAELTTPVSVGNVCVPAAQPWITVGYNVNTFHVPSFSTLNVDTLLTKASGFQFYLTGSFGFPDTQASILTFNMDGSLTVDGSLVTSGNGGGMYSLAAKTTPVTAWHGQAFGGGFYTEATLSHDPQDVIANNQTSFPAWWADPMEHAAEGGIFAEQWPGQATGFVHFTETDFFEYNVVANGNRLFQYNGTAIDWSGIFNGASYPFNTQNTQNRTITLPVGTDFTKPHRYGFLWVPATATVSGYFQWYFDGLPTSDRVTWSQYNCASPPAPPAAGSPTLYGVLDCQHPELLFNPSATGKLRVYSIDVWQKDASHNIVQ
jgi:lysophospholipase L1-like esterase